MFNLTISFLRIQAQDINRAFTDDKTPSHNKQEIFVSWEFPSLDWVKLNIDGASKGLSMIASCGGVIRDSIERWLRGYAANLGIANAAEAEL